jgi:hypothetical protein
MKNRLITMKIILSIVVLAIGISFWYLKPTQSKDVVLVSDKSFTETKSIDYHDFSGNYYGEFNGTEIYLELKSNENAVSGNLTMNGEQATVSAVIEEKMFSGEITENQSRKTYKISAEWKQDKLHFFITFPEYNNQTVEIILNKVAKETRSNSNQNRNAMLFGTWRFTDVIGSGSGSNYMSFSTDYFVKFNSDGTFLSWTGKSAGGSQNASIESGASNNVTTLKWHTSGKQLILEHPITQEKEQIQFYAEINRIMLTFGNNKRVYQRVN